MSKTLYEILEVLEGAAPTEIRDAYRRLAMKWHPDRNPGNNQEAEARFKEIAYAYKVLSEAEERSKYDDLIKEHTRQTSDFSSREKPCGDEGLSGDSAQQLFFEQILDLAADLASRGFTESQILKMLLSLDCPEAIARALSAKAAMSTAKPESTTSGRFDSSRKNGTSHTHADSVAQMSWLQAQPYYAAVIGEIDSASRMDDIEFAGKLARSRIQIGLWLVLGTAFSIQVAVMMHETINAARWSVALGITTVLYFSILIWWVITERSGFRAERALRYYLPIFMRYHQNVAKPINWQAWNFWAGFFWVYWLVYRRMTWIAFLCFIPLGVISYLEAYISNSHLYLSIVSGWVLVAFLGSVANRTYFASARKRIDKFLDLPTDQALEKIRSRSRPVRWSWLWVSVILAFVNWPAMIVQGEWLQKQEVAQRQAQAATKQRAEAEARAATEAAAKEKAEADARARAEEQAAEEQRFKSVVAEMEARHPELNSRNPRFNQNLVDDANLRAEHYIKEGNTPSNALRLAIADMEREASAASFGRR